MDKKFLGKIAIVTGGTSGMGEATVRLLAKEGAEVIFLGRNEEKGLDLQHEITNAGDKAYFFKCDISKENEIIELRKFVENKYTGIDILFNNAGVWITEALENITEEKLNKVFSTNFNSVLFMTKNFEKLLRANKGCIVNNSSMGGLEGFTSGSKQYMYHCSKAAIVKFSKLSAKNLAPFVRVNCICPGLVDTNIFENRDFSRFLDTIPMHRMGDSNEVAKLVAFLSSDDASYITGAVITIDGGASLT